MEGSPTGPSDAIADVPIQHNDAAHRFEARFQEGMAVLSYHYDLAGALVLDHTEVPALLRHQGIATRLAAAALEFASRHQLIVVPVCPFVVAYLREHPEFSALVRRGGPDRHRSAPSRG